MRYLGDDNDPQSGEDVGDPDAGADPGSITVWPEELFDIGPAGGAVANLFTYGPIVLSAAEVVALVKLWKRPGEKSWPWYVLAGFIGLRAFGAAMSLAGSGSSTGVATTSVGGYR